MKRTVPFTLTTTSVGLNVNPGIDTSAVCFASGSGTTVNVALPTIVFAPSCTDARICDDPIPTAETIPAALTVATDGLVLLHVIARVPSAITALVASRALTVA